MARDRERGPMNAEDIETARAELEAIRTKVCRDLARELGGDPKDYRAESIFYNARSDESGQAISDGGE